MGPSNGTPVNFGFTGTNGIAIASVSGTLLQSADVSAEADKEEVRNAVGDIVNRNWHDQHTKASLEWAITGTSIALAVAATVLAGLTPGVIINITACASMTDLVGSNWEVMNGAAIKGSNVTSKRFTVPLERRPGITGPAS